MEMTEIERFFKKIKDVILKYGHPGVSTIDDFEFGRILTYNESNLNTVKDAIQPTTYQALWLLLKNRQLIIPLI